jgi:hypothetical protein
MRLALSENEKKKGKEKTKIKEIEKQQYIKSYTRFI